jgi:iron(III)-enterobactin esterase
MSVPNPLVVAGFRSPLSIGPLFLASQAMAFPMRVLHRFLAIFVATLVGFSLCAIAMAQAPATDRPAFQGRRGDRGPQITVEPLADAVAVELAPPLDASGNFKVSSSDWAAVPVLTVAEGTPRGKVSTFTMRSEETTMYPGVRGPYERNVWVYVPAGYVAGTVLPLMVNHDGSEQSNMQATLIAVLDNYIAEKRLPMMAAVFIANGGGDGPRSERGLEYDTVSGKYAEFIEQEVLPRAEKHAGVVFTKDPAGRGVVGASSGAAAALSMAWFHPDLYRRVISYSGTFVNQAPSETAPHGAWEYHENFIPQSEKKPIRIWLQVGSRDLGARSSENGMHNWVLANNRMAEALKAKGYDYQYLWSENAGHVEKGLVRQTLGEAMEWLWKTYEVK